MHKHVREDKRSRCTYARVMVHVRVHTLMYVGICVCMFIAWIQSATPITWTGPILTATPAAAGKPFKNSSTLTAVTVLPLEGDAKVTTGMPLATYSKADVAHSLLPQHTWISANPPAPVPSGFAGTRAVRCVVSSPMLTATDTTCSSARVPVRRFGGYSTARHVSFLSGVEYLWVKGCAT